MSKIQLSIIIAGFALFVLMFSCSKSEVEKEVSENESLTELSLFLTDGPGDYQGVSLDIEKMKVRIDRDHSSDEEAGEWQELPVSKKRYNLLELNNGKDTLLASGKVFAGILKEIQLSLGENSTLTLENGDTFPLNTPEIIHSRAKLILAESSTPKGENQVVLDFDIFKSVLESPHYQDSSKMVYQFQPHVRIFSKAAGGAVEGWVLPAEALPIVQAINAQKDTLFTKANESGYFKLWGLSEGDYTLRYTSQSESPYKEEIRNISIESGHLITRDTVVLHP